MAARPARAAPRLPLAGLLGTLVLTFAALAPAGRASAHTELESTSPVADSTVNQPVTLISLTFSDPIEPTATALQLFDEQGQPVAIGPVARSDDGATLSTQLAAPLANGRYGVLWQVVSGDGHTLSDSFEFVVDAPVPTTVTAKPTTTVAPTTAGPRTTTTSAPATTRPQTTRPATTAPPTTAAATTAAPTTSAAQTAPVTADDTLVAVPVGGDDGHSDGGSALDEALHSHTSGGDAWWSTPARIMIIGGAVMAIGIAVFAATVLGSDVALRATLVRWVRAAGLLVAVGAVLDALGHSWSLGAGLFAGLDDALDDSLGVAEGLRLVGGLAVALSWSASTATSDRLSGSQVGLAGLRTVTVPAVAGIIAIALSFAFDGHTVTEGPRLLHAAVDTVHVGAASVWVGGIVAFAAVVVLARLREDVPRPVGAAVTTPPHHVDDLPTEPAYGGGALDTLAIGLRFSAIATVALVAVALAGIVMALFILDSPGDLLDTSWGRTLLVKTGATTVAAGLGGFNHFVLLPRLRSDPQSPSLRDALRTTVVCEAVLLVGVVVVAAFLVAAATT